MKERFFEAVRLFKGFLGILHPVEFACDPEAMDAAALRIAKSRSGSFVFCNPDRPDSVGYLQITGTSRGEEIIQFVEVAVEDCSLARSAALPGLRSDTAVSGSLTNQQPRVICRLDGSGVRFMIKDRKLARRLNKYADGSHGGVLSRTGFKEDAVLSKICAVAVDVHDDEVCFSLREDALLGRQTHVRSVSPRPHQLHGESSSRGSSQAVWKAERRQGENSSCRNCDGGEP